MTSWTWGSNNYYDVVAPGRSYYDNFDYYDSFRQHAPVYVHDVANNNVPVADFVGKCVANTAVASTVMGVANNTVYVDNKPAVGLANCVRVANTPVCSVGLANTTIDVTKIEGVANNVAASTLVGVYANNNVCVANSMAPGEASTVSMSVDKGSVVDDVTVTSSCFSPPQLMNTWYYL